MKPTSLAMFTEQARMDGGPRDRDGPHPHGQPRDEPGFQERLVLPSLHRPALGVRRLRVDPNRV